MCSETSRRLSSASRRGSRSLIEHINANDLPARATAAIEGRKGPDILQLLNNSPHLYAGGLEDHNQLLAELGGDKFYPFIIDAVKVDGVVRGVPYFFGGGANTYRKDIFQKVGIDKIPDTWEEHLAAGKKLKKFGMPIGQTLGHTFGDAPGFAYPVLWSFGGMEVDEKGKVAINSKETRAAVDFVKEFWFAACDEGGLAWDDTSNNRAFLAETIACTLNGASIYFVARYTPEKTTPGMADKIGHFLMPRGACWPFPHGGAVFKLHHFILREQRCRQGLYSVLPPERGLREIPRDQQGLYQWSATRMAGSTPCGKLIRLVTIFRELPKYGRSIGYAGPYDRKAAEVRAKYIIVDLFAKVVQGESPQSAIAWAEQELKNVYERS